MEAHDLGSSKRIAFALTALFLSLVLVEGLLRVALPRPGFEASAHAIDGLLVSHPTRGYAYAPGFTGRGGRKDSMVEISINSLGLRDEPVRAGETVDVLAAGDSYTAGWGVEALEAWPSVLQRFLRSKLPSHRPIRVLNAGVSGYSLRQIRLLVEELLYLHPRLVVLGLPPGKWWRIDNPYVYLDGQAVLSSRVGHIEVTRGGYLYSGFDRKPLQRLHFWIMRHYYTGAYLLSSAWRLKKRLAALASGATAPPAQVLAGLLDELRRISDRLDEENVPLVVLLVNPQEDDGRYREREKQYNEIVSAYCEHRGIPVFDPLPRFESTARDRPVYRQGADFHWSARAHALAGTGLAHFLAHRNLIEP